MAETAASSPVNIRVVNVALGVDPALEARVRWVLECLLTPFAVTARFGSGRWAGDADLGYGAPATCTIGHDAAAWEFSDADHTTAPVGDDFATAFWWLSRWEERSADDGRFDEHGRFRFAGSALEQGPDPAPVDTISRALGERLGLELAPWPKDRRYALALSHDIDMPVRWSRRGIRRSLSRTKRGVMGGDLRLAGRELRGLAAMPWWKLRRRDPHMNIPRMAALEARYGGRSTSYVIAGHEHPADGDAEAYAAVRGQVVADVLGSGSELGVHGSYTSSRTAGLLAREREVLERLSGQPVANQRFHYLRHRPPTSWKDLAQAGCTTDSSLGHAERPGFRAGYSYPFRLWDHEAGRPFDIVEVPLAVMEASLGEAHYMGMSAVASWPTVQGVLDHVEDGGGGVSVLWHNDKFAPGLAAGWDTLYERILEHGRDSGAWLASVGDVADHWRARIATFNAAPDTVGD